MTNSNPETTVSPKDTDKKECRHSGRRIFWNIPLVVAAFILLKSAVFMFLWNHLIPGLFHGPALTYVQALGLLVLAKVAGFGGHGRPHWHGSHRHGRWKGGFERFSKLSPEEREKLRDHLRSRWRH